MAEVPLSPPKSQLEELSWLPWAQRPLTAPSPRLRAARGQLGDGYLEDASNPRGRHARRAGGGRAGNK